MQNRPALLPRLFRSKREPIHRGQGSAPEYRGYRPPPPTAGEGTLAIVALFAVYAFGLFVLWLLDWGRSMVLLAVPHLYGFMLAVGAVALVAVFPAKRWGLPIWLQRAFASLAALVAGSLITFLLAGLYARFVASPGLSYRARVIYLEHRAIDFEAEDRTVAVAMRRKLRFGRRGRCFSVRKYEAPFGLSWLELLDASPLPKRGQLEWPISREDCFSDKPLSELGR